MIRECNKCGQELETKEAQENVQIMEDEEWLMKVLYGFLGIICYLAFTWLTK